MKYGERHYISSLGKGSIFRMVAKEFQSDKVLFSEDWPIAFSTSKGVNALGGGDSWRGVVRECSTW